jgi:Gpi18-like mannosyltransferase
MLISPGSRFDIQSWHIVGEIILNGNNPYILAPERQPYFPGWMIFEGIAVGLERTLPVNIAFNDIIVFPIIIADVAVSGIIYKTLSFGMGDNEITPFAGGILHAINPAAIYTSAVHGQTESIAFLFIIIAFALTTTNRWDYAALSLGLGIAVKTVGLLFGPILLAIHSGRLKDRIRFFLLAGTPAAILSIPFLLMSPFSFLRTIFGYGSGPFMSWLYSMGLLEQFLIGSRLLFTHSGIIGSVTKILVIGGILGLSLWYEFREPDVSPFWLAGVLVFVFYSLSAGMAPQYVYWMTPFLPFLPLSNTYIWGISILGGGTSGILWITRNLDISSDFLDFAISGTFSMIFWLASVLILYKLLVYHNDSNRNPDNKSMFSSN